MAIIIVTARQKLLKRIAEAHGQTDWVFDPNSWDADIQAVIDEHDQELKKIMDDPYWYWPQCDVAWCKGVSCSGGNAWRETGYWSVCPVHSDMHRKGLPQPKMRWSAIKREKSRNKDGTLPYKPIKP